MAVCLYDLKNIVVGYVQNFFDQKNLIGIYVPLLNFDFGNRTSGNIAPFQLQFCGKLILQKSVDLFYVGNQGMFDGYIQSILRECKERYPQIRYYVVLPYLPAPMNGMAITEPFETIFPQGLEYAPKRFAICQRNEWMIDHSDIVVTYVTRPFGGAAKYRELAANKEAQEKYNKERKEYHQIGIKNRFLVKKSCLYAGDS